MLWIQSQWDQTSPQRCHLCWKQNAKLWRHNGWRKNGVNEFSTSKSKIYHLKELLTTGEKHRKPLLVFLVFSFDQMPLWLLFWLKNAHFSKTKRNDHVTFHDATKLYGFCAVRIFLLYIFLFLILKLRQKRCVTCNLNSNGDTRVRRLNFPPTYFAKGGIQILCYEFIQI